MIRRFIPILLIIAMLAVPSMAQEATPQPPPECPTLQGQPTDMRVSYYMGEGMGYYQSGALTQARHSFDCIAMVIDTDYVPAFMMRGAILTQLRLYEEAVQDYTRAIQLDSSLAEAYNNRGVLYMALAQFNRAESDFQQAVEIDASFIEAYNNQAIMSALNDDLDTAITILETALNQTNAASILISLEDPERPENAAFPEFDPIIARPFALLGIMNSLKALENYDDYITLTRGGADGRITSAAGTLESQFTFELRLDDGSWLLRADYNPFNQ